MTLTATTEDGSQREREQTFTDERGRFTFERLEARNGLLYAVDARYAGGLFAGGVVNLPTDTSTPPVIETTLRVWDTTNDPEAITLARDVMFVVSDEGGAGVVESVTVFNAGDRAYIGRGGNAAQGETAAPTLGLALPAGVDRSKGMSVVDATLDIPEIVPTSYGFGTTVAIPPGETKVTYAYSVTGDGGTMDLSRVALYPTEDLSIFASDPLEIRSDRLTREGQVTVRGSDYRKWSTDESLDAGDRLNVVAVAEAGVAPALLGGLAALSVAVVGAVLAALVRRRSHKGASRPNEPTRQDLLVAIAELDLKRKSQEVTEDEWIKKRSALKARLESFSGPTR